MVCFSFQLGTRLAEIGPLYDWPNESVILLSKMPQAAVSDPNRQGQERTGRPKGAERLLPPHRSGAIMNRK
jgi:hypothetical protein